MKLLINNARRSLMKSKFHLSVIIFLLVFCGFFYSLFINTITPIINNYTSDITETEVEHFRFYPDIKITNTQIEKIVSDYSITINDLSTLSLSELVSKYNIDVFEYQINELDEYSNNGNYIYEQYNYKNLTVDKTLYTFTTYNGKINKKIFTSGKSPQEKNEIALNTGYALENSINVGDNVIISDQTFSVSGIFYDLGNTLVYDSSNSKSIFAKDNAIVLVNEETFNLIDETKETYFIGKFKSEDLNNVQQIEQLSANNKYHYVTASSDVENVQMFPTTLEGQKSIMYFGSVLIFSITIFFVGLFIINHINSERKQFGVSLAMGFKVKNILLVYFLIPSISFVFLFFGTVLGYLAKGFITTQLSLAFSYPMIIEKPNIMSMFLFSLILTLFIDAFVFYFVYKNLNKPILELFVSGKKVNKYKGHHSVRRFLQKLSFRQHIKASFALSNIKSIITLMLCVIISIIFISISLALNTGYSFGILNYESDANYDAIVSFDSNKSNDNSENILFQAKLFLESIDENSYKKNIDIQFFDLTSKTIDFGENTDVTKQGIIAPVRYQYEGAQVGDNITIKNGDNYLNSQIIGFHNFTVNNTFYASNTLIPQISDEYNIDTYNAQFINSGESLPTEYNNIIYKHDQIDQIKTLQKSSSIVVVILIIFAIVAPLLIIIIVSNQNIKENLQGISILLFSGYKKNDVSSLILNIYFSAVILGGMISFLITPIILRYSTLALNTSEAGFIVLEFNLLQSIYAFIIIVISYFISIKMSKKKYLKEDVRLIQND